MAFERPSLEKLIRRARADIATRLTGADTNLRYSPEEALAIATAGLTHSLHGHLKWLSKQLLVDLADDEFLLRWGSIFGMEKTAAVAATGTITITGTNGTTCPDGTSWQRPSDGTTYTQSGDSTISGGEAEVTLIADEAGAAGNAEVGTTFSIGSPVSGINSSALVSGDGITDGVDTETSEHFRSRVLLRTRNPPKGGGPGDYVNWALEVSGVTRAWEYPLLYGPGTVGLIFVMDDQTPSIIPDSPMVATVQAYIDDLRPVTADLTVLAPTAVDLDITVSITPDNADVRQAVEDSLNELLLRAAEPGATIYLSQINEAISLATGETDHTVTIPAADVTHATTEIAVLGTITYV